MALIPLNKFLTKTKLLPASTSTTATIKAYAAPVGVTSIILMAQIANTSTEVQSVNFIHHRRRPILADAQGEGAQPGNVDSYLVKNFEIPPNDAASVLTGKLIIESLDYITAYASNSGTCQLVLSILETAND